MNWKNILVPHDFSAGAAKAQTLAGDLALRFGGRITLLHVTPLPPGMLPSTLIQPGDTVAQVTVSEYTTRAAAERLEHWADELRAREVTVEVVALLGGIAETILEEAKRRNTDVILMGTHGRRGLSHLLLGSIAEKIVRQADVPVITVRADGEAADPETPATRLGQDP